MAALDIFFSYLQKLFAVIAGSKACTDNPCGNNALCQDTVGGGFVCLCKEGYTGQPFASTGCTGTIGLRWLLWLFWLSAPFFANFGFFFAQVALVD